MGELSGVLYVEEFGGAGGTLNLAFDRYGRIDLKEVTGGVDMIVYIDL